MTANNILIPRDAAGTPLMPSRIQSLNYTTLLGSNVVYTQAWIDSTGTSFTYGTDNIYMPGTNGPTDVNFVSGSVYADQAGTVYIEQSDDKSRVVSSVSIVVGASTAEVIPLQQITSRYYRFRYVNGSSAQGVFTLSQISERIDAFSSVNSTNGNTNQAITSATTTTLKAAPGVLGVLSNGSNALTGVITIYDSLTGSGKVIWSGTMAAGAPPIVFGIPCTIGITVVTAGAQAILVSFA